MVTTTDIAQRHAVYTFSVFVAATCRNETLLTILLLASLGVVKVHSKNSWLFYVACGLIFTLVEILYSVQTWRGVKVPPWTLPIQAIRSQWALDLYFFMICCRRKGNEESPV